jgi:predicted DNA-binding transcriptional regulator AlpA
MDGYWVTKRVLTELGGISKATLLRRRKTMEFPEPLHLHGHKRSPAYYSIQAVKAWIAAHFPEKPTDNDPQPVDPA